MADRSPVSELAERAMRSVLLTLSHRKSLGRLATRLPVTRPMVRRFVAGESMDEALPAIERLHEQGMGDDRRRARRVRHRRGATPARRAPATSPCSTRCRPAASTAT